jgi:GNAT superfamily N-acetyltransferase
MEENYILTEVTNNKLNRAFLEMPVSLYRNDKNWIRPLDDDINKIFDPNRNKLHKNGESVRWILYDSHGKAVGRIAAFYNNDNSDKEEQPTGGIGFFECINDQKAADTMFDAARAWLKDKGMEAMDGPINFGSRETFWGCLHDGFYPPNYNMPYNYKYYNDLFTNYGFKIYFYQYTFHMKLIPDSMDPVIYEKGRNIQHNNEYNFRNIDKNNLDKYVDDFLTVFNETWARFPGVKPLSKAQTTKMFDKLKIILDPRVMIFAYYKERPIGFFIMIPDLYEVTKHFNGKFNLINKLRLIYNLKVRKVSRKVIGLIFGVVPDFQNKGVADGMILTFEDEVRKKNFKYTDLEMNWIGDFNTAMIKLEEYLGATIRKKHITYRYLFDRNKEFKRAQRL